MPAASPIPPHHPFISILFFWYNSSVLYIIFKFGLGSFQATSKLYIMVDLLNIKSVSPLCFFSLSYFWFVLSLIQTTAISPLAIIPAFKLSTLWPTFTTQRFLQHKSDQVYLCPSAAPHHKQNKCYALAGHFSANHTLNSTCPFSSPATFPWVM